jgi:hypothetical protein
MRVNTFVLPAAALGLGALLLAPSQSVGFSTIGGSLSQSQRDFRVYNNFTGSGANNNTTPHYNFPGYDGAEMAIWKGCIEWSSERHADGQGDPHQNAGLGSGGANFDPIFCGNATQVGNTNANVHSQISGGGGGTLAFTETPISDGWRIRYYQNWSWQDGPNTLSSGVCLQGVSCHEYGHALGLGHSTASGATMQAFIAGTGTAARSINSDDQAGVRFVYGVRDTAVKPSITALTGGTSITITGFNFAATGNEVWFNSGGLGNPVKVTGLSSNGTSIALTAPGNAFPGDVMVKKGGNGSHKGLSNPWPWDPNALTFAGCGNVVQYCEPSLSASGCQAALATTGSPSATAPAGFTVSARDLAGASEAVLLFGTGPQPVPWGGGTSFQCIASPGGRSALQATAGTPGACDGSVSIDLNALWQANPALRPEAGADLTQAASFSSAVRVDVCP